MTLGGEAVAVPYPQVQPVARLKIYSNRHTHTHTESATQITDRYSEHPNEYSTQGLILLPNLMDSMDAH